MEKAFEKKMVWTKKRFFIGYRFQLKTDRDMKIRNRNVDERDGSVSALPKKLQSKSQCRSDRILWSERSHKGGKSGAAYVGSNRAFPVEKGSGTLSFSQDVLFSVYSARTMRLRYPDPGQRSALEDWRRFFWNCRKSMRQISTL